MMWALLGFAAGALYALGVVWIARTVRGIPNPVPDFYGEHPLWPEESSPERPQQHPGAGV